LDAFPDIRHQQTTLHEFPEYAGRVGNAFDAVFLTHAHMGHYTGLVHFGKEAHASHSLPTYGSKPMVQFLSSNEPWATLIRGAYLRLEVIADGATVRPLPDISVTGLAVPHRPDLSDTFGYLIETEAGASVLYVPDIDRWSDWPVASAVIASVDIALIDGTFFSTGDEVGSHIEDIPHPNIEDSVEQFGDLAGETHIVFTHLNHSNPAAEPDGDQARWVTAHGFTLAFDGMTFDL
jgi:pyrroloquinoline quinone biosynthesis protein B